MNETEKCKAMRTLALKQLWWSGKIILMWLGAGALVAAIVTFCGGRDAEAFIVLGGIAGLLCAVRPFVRAFTLGVWSLSFVFGFVLKHYSGVTTALVWFSQIAGFVIGIAIGAQSGGAVIGAVLGFITGRGVVKFDMFGFNKLKLVDGPSNLASDSSVA